DPGHQPGDRGDHRRQQPRGGSHVRAARPEDPLLAMADGVQTLPVSPSLAHPWRGPRVARLALDFARRKPLGAIGGVIVLVLLVMAVFADRIAPHPYSVGIAGARMKAPSAQFWMGTDNLSRAIWS